MKIIHLQKSDIHILAVRLRALKIYWEVIFEENEDVEIEIYANEEQMSIVRNFLNRNATFSWEEVA